MNRKKMYVFATVFVITMLLGSAYTPNQVRAQSDIVNGINSTFTYQGQLKKNDSPYNGSCNFTFTLWDTVSDVAIPLGSESKMGVNVSGGVFTVQLNEASQFGANAFDGNPRWLGIIMQCAGDSGPTDLGRQVLSTAPYAIYAITAGSVTNGVVTSGSYSDPSWITSLSAGKISGILPVANGGTGSAVQNFVDLSSTQSISGTKAFTSAPSFSVASGAPFAVSSAAKVTNLNADKVDGMEASALQARVNGTCAVGSTIQVINADGSVVCQADAPLNRGAVPQANIISKVDSGLLVLAYSSITIGVDGLPVISYFDFTTVHLNVLHCGNVNCNGSNTDTIVDSAGDVGRYTSITLGSDGQPVISYYDLTNGDLKMVHCGNATCSSGNTIATLDSSGNIGEYTSITIGSDGLPAISYYDVTNGDLKVFHCGTATCSSGNNIITIDSAGNVGQYTSITLGSDGRSVISYYDITNGDLKVAHCGNASCISGNMISTVDTTGDVGQHSSIIIGVDGLPVISYLDFTNKHLKVLHCSAGACNLSNTITTVDSDGEAGAYTSITIGVDGLPVISYYDATPYFELRVLHCGNTTCIDVGNTITSVDTNGGQYTSITIGADGLPILSYYDGGPGDLKVAHCTNVFCRPYFRRR